MTKMNLHVAAEAAKWQEVATYLTELSYLPIELPMMLINSLGVSFHFSKYDVEEWWGIPEDQGRADTINRMLVAAAEIGGKWRVGLDPDDKNATSLDKHYFQLINETFRPGGMPVVFTMPREYYAGFEERIALYLEGILV
jgi:hypothetical protein